MSFLTLRLPKMWELQCVLSASAPLLLADRFCFLRLTRTRAQLVHWDSSGESFIFLIDGAEVLIIHWDCLYSCYRVQLDTLN